MGFNDVRNTEIHTVELTVPEPSVFEFELAIGKQTIHKSQDFNPIPVETD